ncbi:MAG TPA: hypothetical protein EYQ18_17230 [Candidatus Handelsmanbacteria bacterium]|nr:hypothetical protein [Candidatus Handelsmanbacteria bacterium]
MASKRDNQLLTQTGAGTPMGDLMRHFWIPAARSDELVADGAAIVPGAGKIGFRLGIGCVFARVDIIVHIAIIMDFVD